MDLDLYRKLAGTYGVASSEENAVNEFVKQSDKIYDATLSMYDILSPSKRGDSVVITTSDGVVKNSRAVFNYNKVHTESTMNKNQERCFLASGDGSYGNYVEQVRTGDTYIVELKDKNRFDYDDVFVRKCNAYLRFYDSNGVYREIKARVEDENSNTTLSENKYMTLTNGELYGLVQTNSITSEIKEGSEFIFGNLGRYKYRVSYLNDFQFNGLTILNFERYQINTEVDNLELGIANYTNRPTFTLTVSPIASQISIGDSVELDYQLLDKDSIEVEKDITWTSSDDLIATVDNDGLVSAIGNGTVSITATMTNNSSVYDSTDVEITETPIDNFEIVIDNGDLDILRTDTQTFVWSMLNNGIITTSNFTFAINSSSTATSEQYLFTTVDGNTYTIKNVIEGGTLIIDIEEDGGLTKQVTYNFVGYW